MPRSRRSPRSTVHRHAAAAVEFAMALPLLALATSAAVDFGRVYHVVQVLDQCAASGALAASGTIQYPSAQSPADAAAAAACADGASLAPALVAGNVSTQTTSTAVTVTVQYDFATITPVHGLLGTITLSRSLTMNLAPKPGS